MNVSKFTFFKNSVQTYHQSAKLFRSRSGQTCCRAGLNQKRMLRLSRGDTISNSGESIKHILEADAYLAVRAFMCVNKYCTDLRDLSQPFKIVFIQNLKILRVQRPRNRCTCHVFTKTFFKYTKMTLLKNTERIF